MPVLANNAIHLRGGTLGELHDALTTLRLQRGDDLLVLTEVCVNADVCIGRAALSVRVEQDILTISADRTYETGRDADDEDHAA